MTDLQGYKKKKIAPVNDKKGFKGFFRLVKKHFGKLTTTNMLFTLCNFPVFFFLLGMSGNFDTFTKTPVNPLFAQIFGIIEAGGHSPASAVMYGIVGGQTELKIMSTTSTVLIFLTLLLVFTFGLSSVGLFYNLRCMYNENCLYPVKGFFEAIKKNLKQGLIFGVLDFGIILLLIYDFAAYRANSGAYMYNLMFIIILIIIVLYYMIRIYAYTLIVTFDLPLTKILKNSFNLTLLGFKRTAVAVAASLAVALVSVYFYAFFQTAGLILPMIFTIAFICFIGSYCAYPVIDEYIIQPYYSAHPEEVMEEEDIEPIFTDEEHMDDNPEE